MTWHKLFDRQTIRAFGLLCLISLSGISLSAQGQLQLNQTIKREIEKDQIQAFKIKVTKGDFFRLVVRQIGANVSLRLVSAKNETLVESDNSESVEEPERISYIASESGEFLVEVKCLKVWNLPANYELQLDQLRPSTVRDERRIEAERLYDQAILDWFSNKPDAKDLAVKAFRESVPLFEAAGDRFGEAYAHYYLGVLYLRLNDAQRSIESSARSARIFREINAVAQLAMVLSNEAAVQYKLGSIERAKVLSEESLEIYRRLGDKRNIAKVGGNLALIASGSGQSRQALKQFQELLPIFAEANDLSQEAWALHNIGSILDDLGEPVKAAEYLEKALKIRLGTGEKSLLAATLVNLASVNKNIGELQKAADGLKQALDIFRELGNEINQTFCLNNLGAVYDDLGDYAQAREFYERSLELNRKLGLRSNEAANLNNLGLVSLKNGGIDLALRFQTESVAIYRALGNKVEEAKALLNLSVMFQRKGDRVQALELLRSVLPVFRDAALPDWEANTLFRTGEVLYLSGDYPKSLESCTAAVEINRAIQSPSGESVSLLCAAKNEARLAQYAESQKKTERALTLIEDSRTKIGRRDLQATYFATKQEYYEFYVDLLMRRHKIEPGKGFDALAFEASERMRARSLLESIGQIRIREGIPFELSDRERNLRQTINAKALLRQELIARKSDPERTKVEREIAELIREHREIEAKVRSANPKFANFSDAKPLKVKQIQSTVLDDESVLLEYSIGAERSFLFVVAKDSLKVVELPGRAEVERLARVFRDSLNARAVPTTNESEIQTETRIRKADAELDRTGAELTRILLRPVAGEIANKRLLVVTSEVLQYIPFAALPNTNAASRFLIQTNEIVHLPSASALAYLRDTARRPATKEIAIFADPVFDASDERLRQVIKSGAKPLARGPFARLVFSSQEAESISMLAPPENLFIATGFDANLSNLRKLDMGRYRILHFATHSSLDDRFNELSGVVLSLVDEKGAPREGIWRLNEIYNLTLNTELVVLSACETALGSEIRGEGLVGFTYSFMYSGARSVVASLWLVDDRPTYKLMQRFYQAMLKDKLPPSKALRAAQISMINEKGLDRPFFWSAFTLQGEWR